MKTKQWFLIAVCIWMLAGVFTGQVFAQNKQRGMWVWSVSSRIITDFANDDSTDWENFLSFCEAPHGVPADRLTNIYMSALSTMRIYPERMRAFLTEMNSRGFKLYLVISDPIFAVPNYNDPVRGNVRTDFEAYIDNFITFQKKGHANERFAGIMLDIEPHLLTSSYMANPPLEWNSPDHFPVIWETYLNDLSYCRSEIDTYNGSYDPDIGFSDAVAHWYDIPEDRDGDGTDEILSEDIITRVDFYTVQAYRDITANIISVATGELTESYRNGIECVVGVETMPNSETNITFWEEGHTALETSLDSIAATYADNDGFGGFAIHSYANASTAEEGYQDLLPATSDEAPLITITEPNGVQVEGISHSDDLTITWEVENPDNRNYDISLTYKYQSELDNDQIAWHSIYSAQNVSAATTQGSYVWDTTGVSTSQTNRVIIKADVQYASSPTLPTSDRTNFGVGINEIPDIDVWSDILGAHQDGLALGPKVIREASGVMHMVYYRYWGGTKGVYYARSTDVGANWTTTNLTPGAESYIPRKPVFAKNGDFLAVAWLENDIASTTLINKRIYVMFSDDNGLTWQGESGSTSKEFVNTLAPIQANFPEVCVSSDGTVHIVWSEIRNTGSWGTYIVYSRYDYSTGTGQWTGISSQIVKSMVAFSPIVNTPSVCETANGNVHVIWGEHSRSGTLSVSMAIKSKTYTTVWNTEQTIYTRNYSPQSDERSGSVDVFDYYPVYFPKIAALNNYVYAVWQDTTKGTDPSDLRGGLPEFSNVYFAKRDASSTSNPWATAVNLTSSGTGYAPAITVKEKNSSALVQILYTSNYAKYTTDIYTGDVIHRESTDGGTTFATPSVFVSGSGLAAGARRAYINIGSQAVHYGSYPYIYSNGDGFTTTNWIDGSENEKYKVRGIVTLDPPSAPFADIHTGGGFTISWDPPDTEFAPTGYKLRRIPDNNTAAVYELNSGNSIYSIEYFDNDSITAGTHYRYELSYLVNGSTSPWSSQSNAVKSGTMLLIDDFELDGSSQPYTGITYSFFDAHKPITGVITDELAVSGSYSYKITYTDNDSAKPQGAFVSLAFPATMDFSGYSSLDLKIRFNPEVGMLERDVEVQLVEAETGEAFRVGSVITLEDDGAWHLHHLFFDQVSAEVNGVAGATLDLDKIEKINFVTWGNGSTSYYIDDLELTNSGAGDAILFLDTDWITMSTPVQNTGQITGYVANQPLTPVTLNFGNAPEPWSIRIYTVAEVKNNAGQVYTITRDGLIRYDQATDTVYPQYTIPVKVWCKNYGPPGFFNTSGDIVNSTYAQNGYPPIDNQYFFRGYDFNDDDEVFGLLPPSEGPFIEGTGAGEYPFDLDGDGFTQGDNFFAGGEGRAAIAEEPVWLFVPVMQHDTEPPTSGAIVMDPNDESTWRVLTDSTKGAGDHTLELYFAVFIGEQQMLNTLDPDAYGDYTGIIVVDISYN